MHQVPAEYITLIWHYAQIPKDEVAEELTLFMQEADTRFSEAVDDAERFTTGTLPNGLAFASNGDILISNFGTDRLERMTRTGESTIISTTASSPSPPTGTFASSSTTTGAPQRDGRSSMHSTATRPLPS